MKCPKCELESRQLNGFMSRHYKKHITEEYTRENYLEDLLTLNGKPPNLCPICGKKTKYQKEEASWSKYCSRECFFESTKGKGNPNYKNKLKEIICKECGKVFNRHESQVIATNIFCSYDCNASFYSKPENLSEKKIQGRISTGITMKEIWQDDEYRTKMATSMNEAFKDGSSKVEKEVYEMVKGLYPDARHQELVGYYSFDIFIPSLGLLIEFDGTYWHGPRNPTRMIADRRKSSYITNNKTNLKLIRIKEYCWNKAENKIEYLKSLITNYRKVVFITGPSGSGKSYVCNSINRFPVVNWDKISHKEDFIKSIIQTPGDIVIAQSPILVSTNIKKLVNLGFSVDLICITETPETIRERLEGRGGRMTDSVVARIKRFQSLSNFATFFGTTAEVLLYLKNWDLVS